MKIVINGYFFAKTKSGIGQYFIHILTRLIKKSNIELIIVVPSIFQKEVSLNVSADIQSFVQYLDSTWMRDSLLGTLLWERMILSRYIWKMRPDVVWSPSFSYIRVPQSTRLVMTIHDVIPWKLPEYSYTWKRKLYNLLLERTMVTARLDILTVSEFSKQEIIEILKISPSRISVTPLASSKKTIQTVHQNSSHQKPYMVYVGGMERRKNLDRLLQAVAILKKTNPDFHLIITGNYHSHTLITSVPELIQHYDVGDVVSMTGFISDEELTTLIMQSKTLIYPSLYEGFGLPILEGMELGVPVITSNIGVMPEVAGGAAYLINPYSVEDMAQGMQKVWLDDALRETLCAKGFKQVQTYQWDVTAEKTFEVLKRKYQ